jgi:hypothetical protein
MPTRQRGIVTIFSMRINMPCNGDEKAAAGEVDAVVCLIVATMGRPSYLLIQLIE